PTQPAAHPGAARNPIAPHHARMINRRNLRRRVLRWCDIERSDAATTHKVSQVDPPEAVVTGFRKTFGRAAGPTHGKSIPGLRLGTNLTPEAGLLPIRPPHGMRGTYGSETDLRNRA